MANKPGPGPNAFIDFEDHSEGHWYARKRVLVSKRTAFQQIDIFEHQEYGRMLALDGALQSAQGDEYVYHEALIQPAMFAVREPRKVLIIGGGEGASAREVLRHPSVERVVMVDLDEEVVALCREHLPTWHQGAFDDPRFELVIQDGSAYIAASEESFDVIVVDVVDSFDGGPAEALYTTQFYRQVKQRLALSGVLVVQSMECHASEYDDHRRVRQSLAPVFRFVRTYTTYVPTFWSEWGYVFASDVVDPVMLPVAAVDSVITERGLSHRLEFYDGTTHQRMFTLSKDLRRALGDP